jgi:hypothetical protein
MACYLVLLFLFIFISILSSKRNRIVTAVLSIFFAGGICLLSYGAYLFLEKPLWQPRAFAGFGAAIAIILTFNVIYSQKIKLLRFVSIAAALILNYNFLIFGLMYGNAFFEQREYEKFRATILISDLNRFITRTEYGNGGRNFVFSPENEMYFNTEWPIVRLENSVGYPPVVESMSIKFPVIKRFVYVGLVGTDDNWWGHLPLLIYGFPHRTNYYEEKRDWVPKESLPVLSDNGYHTIRGNGEQFFVTLKGSPVASLNLLNER